MMIGQGNTRQEEFEPENLETNEIGMGASNLGTTNMGGPTGVSTSAVSSLFSDSMVSDPRRRYMIMGSAALLVVAVAAVVYFVFMGDGQTPSLTPPVASTDSQMPTAATETGAEMQDQQIPSPDGMPAESMPGMEGSMPGGGAMGVSIVSPVDGQSRDYDQTMGGAIFSWQGMAEYISFARNSEFVGARRTQVTDSNEYVMHHPVPGQWFWRLEDSASNPLSETFTFYVANPVPRNISISEPQAGGSISSGGTVSWMGDEKISFYRVELASGGFSNPNYRFSTVGTSLNLEGVSPGSYQLRLGAFSEVIGAWEYSEPVSINIQ